MMIRQKKPAYLFTKEGLTELTDFVDGATLYAFDLDGTLAPIVFEPGAISISEAVRAAFAKLISLAPVAVLTGRSRADALLHLGVEPRYLIGNHGVEGLPGWSLKERDFVRMAQKWRADLADLIPPDEHPGIDIENKGATLSIHYRRAACVKAALDTIGRAVGRLVPAPRRIRGKFVENLLPEGAPDKGDALNILMHHEGFQKAFFAGDDETDEQVFGLDSGKIFSVRVGKINGSRAGFYLRDQQEMARLLCSLNTMLNSQEESV